MKSKTTLLLLFSCALLQFAQAQIQASQSNQLLESRKVSFNKPVHTSTANGSRASSYSAYVDYGAVDEYFSSFIGSSYIYYVWPLNKNFENDDTYSLRTAAVVFDSLFYLYNGSDPAYHPRATSMALIDSLQFAFVHYNVTSSFDTLTLTVFDADNYSINGGGASAELITPAIWDTTIIFNTSLSVDSNTPVGLTVYPALQLNTGQLFGVRIDFAGDVSNIFRVIGGAREDCFSSCGANQTIAGDHSYFYLNAHVPPNPNFSGFTPMYFDCNSDSAFNVGACEEMPLQDIFIAACLTVQADTVIPVTLSYIPAGMNEIAGFVFRDVNQNGVYDGGDGIISNKSISFNHLSFVSTSNGYFARLSDGNYTVTAPSIPSYTLTTQPTSFQFNLSNQIDTVLNFGYVPSASSDNVSIITAVAPSVCSNLINIWTTVFNEGTVTQDVRVTIFVDSSIFIIDAPGNSDLQPHQVTWLISSMQPLTEHALRAMLQIPSFLSMGDTISYVAVVEKYVSGDWIGADSYTITDIIVCSYDPNDKRVFPQGEVYQNQTLLNTPLHYNVRFQNTGNYPAIKVEIRDTLDTNLNYSTFRLLSASHPVTVQIENYRYVSFLFEYINLPDSGSNEPGSHGYVSYSIEPLSNVTSGTEVSNTAHIYFDYNPAVVTNTTSTEYVNQFPLGLSSIDGDGILTARPNPFSDASLLSWSGNNSSSVIKVYNSLGALVLNERITGNSYLLRKNSLAKGVYFVQLTADKSYSGKMVIE